jgi:hypothetical protein
VNPGGFLRPEALAALARWRKVAGALALAAAGLWVAGLGGWFFLGAGALLAAAGAGGALLALRRLRFAREVTQPGVVEIDEGQVRYFGPEGGGFAAFADLVALDLLTDARGRRCWRLTEAEGGVLDIPVAALGADRLFEAFAAFPGLSSARLVAAIEAPAGPRRPLWRRARPEAHRALT